MSVVGADPDRLKPKGLIVVEEQYLAAQRDLQAGLALCEPLGPVRGDVDRQALQTVEYAKDLLGLIDQGMRGLLAGQAGNVQDMANLFARVAEATAQMADVGGGRRN